MFKRIDHVEIVTDQPDQTVQFYTEVLGFTVKARDRISRPVSLSLTAALKAPIARAADRCCDSVVAHADRAVSLR